MRALCLRVAPFVLAASLMACGDRSPGAEGADAGDDAGAGEVEGPLPGDDVFGDGGADEGGTINPPGEADAGPPSANGCPVLTFPSGRRCPMWR
jgi:hypothetical protein